MIVGASVVATLCRDRAALQMFLYGYIAAALWLGAVISLTGYGALSGVMPTDYNEASQIRGEAFRNSPIHGNLNGWAITCAQGAVVALAFALACGSPGRRNLFFSIAAFCFTASALAMSRGGIVISLLSCALILSSRGIRHARTLILVAALGACVFLVVPGVIWSRMVFSMEGEQGKESRAALYRAAVDHWPEYIITGVGTGNFLSKWGLENGFALGNGIIIRYEAIRVHNSFLQVTINWGLVGLLAFLAIIWRAYRCVPKRCGSDPLTLSLLGIAVSMFLILHVSHNFNDKALSLGLGMLVAYQRWLAPSHAEQSTDR
jgi:O-antigen ligase